MRKCVFDIKGNEVKIYYHYKEGQIFREPLIKNRQDLISQGKSGEMNEKDTDESKEQQENNFINQMEQKCHAAIKANEKTAMTERDQRKDKEKIIA